jgi:hypothetical protein
MFDLFNKFKKSETEKTEIKTESKSFYDKYLSSIEEIKYLEEKYDDFIIRSLEVDFEQYKDYVDQNYPKTINGSTTYWMFSEMKYDEFKLKKSDSSGSISIDVRYSFYGDKWELKTASASINWNSTHLTVRKVNKIIFDYFIYWKLKEVERQKSSKKEAFQKMVDIIGKDVKRDSLIDQILS